LDLIEEKLLDFAAQLAVGLTLVFVPYVSSFCHEFGHALLARCVGYEVASFGMGMGRPFLVRRLGGTRIYLSLTRPYQGLCHLVAAPPLVRWRRVCMLLGGVLANALLALAAVGLLVVLEVDFAWRAVLWCSLAINGLAVVVNLVPLDIRAGPFHIQNDGWQILRVLRGKAVATQMPQHIENLQGLEGLWRQIDDRPRLYYHLMMAAAAW
jgi:membrane-associated protease RseP (regulator of RpoE activity)